MADRLDWIKEKVVSGLAVSEKDFDALLEQAVPDGKTYYEELLAFFDKETAETGVILFYAEEKEEEGGTCPHRQPGSGWWMCAEVGMEGTLGQGGVGWDGKGDGEGEGKFLECYAPRACAPPAMSFRYISHSW